MRKPFASIAAILAAAGSLALPAHAGSVYKINSQNAATACTLSIPTTDTKVRPKATGFRNEGTTAPFVICGFDIDSSDPGFHAIALDFISIDGAAHNFNCTAAGRIVYEAPATKYLTKSVSVPASTTTPASFSISDTDPDYDPAVYDLYPWGQSITCQLPPGVAILSVRSEHDDEDSGP